MRQEALIGEALRKTTLSMRNLNNVLIRKERSDLIGKLRDTIKDTQQRAVGDMSVSESDEKAESSVGMSGRSSYIKYLSDYRNMKSSSTPPQTLKRWAARNLDFSGKSGYGKIPFDESVRTINPQSRWTLEQLSRDRDKMVRADAKRTMAKMKSTKGNLDGKSISLYDAQKIEAEKILRVLNKYEDSPDTLYKYHNVQTERIRGHLKKTEREDESASRNFERKRKLFDSLLNYEKIFEGPGPNTESKINNAQASLQYLEAHIEVDDDSGRIIIPRLTTKQVKNIRITESAGDDINEYIEKILSGQAREASSVSRGKVREICDDIAKFRYAKRYISDAGKRLSIINDALKDNSVTKKNIDNTKSLAKDLEIRIKNVAEGLESGNRAKIRSVDLLFDEESNKYNSYPQPMAMVDNYLGIKGLKWSPALQNIKRNMKKQDDGTRARLSRNPDHYRDRPASKNLWWEEYAAKIVHAKLYRNEYEYNSAAVLVVLCSAPSIWIGNNDSHLSGMKGDEILVQKHIRELTSGSGTQYRVGQTAGDLPNVWPQFRGSDDDPDIPKEVLEEGYIACIESLATLVGYFGKLPSDPNSMQRIFAEESMRIEAKNELKKELGGMSYEERLDERYVPDEIGADITVDYSESLPEGYTDAQPEAEPEVQPAAEAIPQGVPAVDVLPEQGEASIDSYEQLEDGASYSVISNPHESPKILSEFTFYNDRSKMGPAYNLISVFFSNPNYSIMKSEEASVLVDQ
jgi:hypothetical protein